MTFIDQYDPDKVGTLSLEGPKREPRNDVFSKFDPFPDEEIGGFVEPKENVPSATGAFVRGAARSAVPALGSIPAIGAGAELGGAGGFAVGGPPGALIGGIAGGLAGGFGGASLIAKGQDWFLSKLPSSWTDKLGLSERQEQLDQKYHGTASFLGGLAPYAVTMRPGVAPRGAVSENATALQRIMAHPATSHLFGGAVVGGMELGQEVAHGDAPDWTKVGISTGFGVVFNRPTRIGETLTQAGARPTLRLLGHEQPATAPAPTGEPAAAPAETPSAAAEVPAAPPSPLPPPVTATDFRREISERTRTGRPYELPPTVADAADLKVMGPGITEDVFRGSHEMSPAAEEAAREQKRTEASVIGPEPAEDVHAMARRMHVDLFDRYEELKAQEAEFARAPDSDQTREHLASTRRELGDLHGEIQAAYRRAAEATGAETVEPAQSPAPPTPAEPVTPPQMPAAAAVPSHVASIAAEEARRNMAAGIPRAEAHAAAAVQAHMWDTRATRFNGAKGTAAEMYAREAPDVRGGPGVRAAETPVAAEVITRAEAALQKAETVAPSAPAAPEPTPATPADATLPPDLRAVPEPGSIPNGVQMFAPGDLIVDAKRFQFKDGGDEAGVTDRLKGVTRWDPIRAGMTLVWQDRAGKHYVVDGHQRHGLASRIAADDPSQNPQLLSRVVREADGISDVDARIMAAAKNIAEGTGTAVDAAKVLRDRPALAAELPPRSELVRQARGLVNLSDDAFRMVVNDVVPPNYAAIVGQLVPHDAELQSALLSLLAKTEPANAVQAEAIVRQGIEAGIAKKEQSSQGSLFGDDDVATSLYADRAKVLDKALRDLKRDKAVFSVLTREQSSIEAAGNKLAAGINESRAAADAQALQVLQVLAGRKGPISDALNAAARRARSDGKPTGAVRDFIAEVRRLVQTGDLARLADGVERGPAHVGAEDAASTVERAPEQPGIEAEKKATADVRDIVQQAAPEGRSLAVVSAKGEATLSRLNAVAGIEAGRTVVTPQITSASDFAGAVAELKARLGKDKERKVPLGEDVVDAEVVPPEKAEEPTLFQTAPGKSLFGDDFEASGLARDITAKPEALHEGSTLRAVATEVKAFSDDAQALLGVARQHDGFDVPAGATEREALVNALADARDLLDDHAQTGYDLVERIEKIGDEIHQRVDKLEDDYLALRREAEDLRDRITEKYNEIVDDVLAELIERRQAEEEAAEEAARASGEEPHPNLPARREDVEPPPYPAHYTALDVLVHENRDIAAELERIKSSPAVKELLDADIDQLDEATADRITDAVQEDVSAVNSAYHAADFWTGKVSNFKDNVSLLMDSVNDDVVRPLLDAIEEASIALDERVEQGLESDTLEQRGRRGGPAPGQGDMFARIEDATQRVEANPADQAARQELRSLVDATKAGPQNVLPGFERSAVQAAASREAAGGLRSERTQEAPGELFAERRTGQTELFQREPVPTFYSAVSRAVDSAKQDKASPTQWLGMLKNMPGVKPEEMQWLGLEDWLRKQKGSVTKAEIADYVRANQTEVKEVTKGNAFEGDDLAGGILLAMGRQLDEIHAPEDIANAKRYNTSFRATVKDASDADIMAAVERAREGRKLEPSKFSSYQLPGGENYRELLLTLPGKEPEPFKPTQAVTALPEGYHTITDRNAPADQQWGVIPPGQVHARFFAGAHPTEEAATTAAIDEINRRSNALEMREYYRRAEEGKFKSSHFDEPNILAHIRFNDRTIDGKKTLFVEEVQSDWHQKGKKQGYQTQAANLGPLIEADNKARADLEKVKVDIWHRLTDGKASDLREAQDQGFGIETIRSFNRLTDTDPTYLKARDEAAATYNALADARAVQLNTVPDAPFKTTWPELAMKRMIRYAAENGYEKVAWTTGETQAARYDLSKQIAELGARRYEGRTYGINAKTHKGEHFTVGDKIPENELADHIGKELAEKIANQAEDFKKYEGLDLKVGGEGMKGFYDQILPATVNKLVKKFGGKVGKDAVGVKQTEGYDIERAGGGWRLVGVGGEPIEGAPIFRSGADAEEWVEKNKPTPVHSLDISDKLRDAATEQGFTLFQNKDVKRGSYRISDDPAVRDVITYFKDANASTLIHEPAHGWLNRMMKDAADEAAPEQLKADAKTTLDWLGVSKAEDLNERNAARNLTARARKANEKFARGFEAYVMEGWAPSQALARVFEQFRQWLAKVYGSLKQLEQEAGFKIGLTDEMRAVFDRLLAAEPRQRTVIAPDREPPAALADVHEADAAAADQPQTEPVAARVDAERERAYNELPHDIRTELDAAEARQAERESERAAPEPGGTPSGGQGGPGAIQSPGGGPAVESAGGGGGETPGAERGGVRQAPPESAGVPQQRPAGAGPGEERAGLGDLPLAPHAATGFPASTFNVGKDGNVRVENITSVPQFQAAIEEAAQRVGGGGATTMGDMLALADDLALDPKTIDEGKLAALFGGVRDLAPKIWALRRALRAQSEAVHNLMQQVAATPTDEAAAAYAKERSRFEMMYSVLSSVTTEAGRGLGMGFRNMEGWDKVENIGELVKGKTGLTLFQLKMEAKLGARLDSPAKVAKFLRDAQKRSFGGMLTEYWINGLISGIATHVTYGEGNTILSFMKAVPETLIASAVGSTRSAFGRQGERVYAGEAFAGAKSMVTDLPRAVQAALEAMRTGQPTLLPGQTARPLTPFLGDTALTIAKSITNDPVTWREVGAQLYGMIRGGIDGVKAGAELIAAGGAPGAPLAGFQYSPLGQIPDIAVRGVPVLPLGSAVRLPGRSVAAIHSFFATSNYTREIAAEAYRTASAEGRNGNDFASRIGQIRINPDDAMMERARTGAYASTLMSEGGQFVKALSALTNAKAKLPFIGEIAPLKFIDPFVHIGANVIDQAIVQRTPLGILSSEIRADLMGKNGNIAQDFAMARMLAGTSLSLVFGWLAMEGYASGSGPSDGAKSAMWRLAGNQPHSVRIGDIWYQVNRLGPIGMLLSTAADMYDVAHDASQGELLTAAAHLQHAITQNILDESFMRGPSDLIKAVEDPGRYGEGYLKNFASSFVPFSVGMFQIARASDPYARQARTVMDAIKQKIPGQSETLFPRIDVWGQPIHSPEALGMRGLTAVYETQVSRDPVNKAMLDLGIAPARLDRKIRNVELTDAEYDDFARLAGRMTKLRLDSIVRSPDYATWPAHIRHDVIAETIRQSREAARGMMFGKYPHLVRDAVEEMKKKRLGDPQSIH